MMMCCMLGLELGVHAQESVFLQQYREKVKADFLPSLSGNANASYTGNPLELYRELPSIETPLYFQGRDTKYGASVTLLQPVYSGGALKVGLEKSRKEKESALYEEKRVTNDVLYQADQYYWNKVAVNCICPGYFPTEMTAAYIDAPFFHQAHLECCPMERHGETGEMDGLCTYFASPACSYTTGQIVCVDGGWSAI